MSLPSNFPDSRVCIVGLGYVGLTLAVAMADSGFHVHGVEVRADVLAGLAEGKPHFWEPRLKEKLGRVIGNGTFTFSAQLDESVTASVFIITVGTPLDKDGKAKLSMAESATRQVVAHMSDNALIILRSTVKLGTTRKVVKPILEASRRPFQIAFCPERTLEGKALIELHQLPQIIGADDSDTRWRCQQLFGQLTPTTVAVASLEAAELVKALETKWGVTAAAPVAVAAAAPAGGGAAGSHSAADCICAGAAVAAGCRAAWLAASRRSSAAIGARGAS